MSPFVPFPLISGIKDKVEAILSIGDRLYIAIAGGTIQTYQVQGLQDVGTSRPKAILLNTRKGLFRKPVDQLEYVEDIDALVVLSDQTVTLYDLPNLKTPTVLSQARYIQSISTRTIWVPPSRITKSIKTKASKTTKIEPATAIEPDEPCTEDPSIRVSILVLGARKKVHVATYVSGKPYISRELALQHSPRLIVFPSTGPSLKNEKERIHLHYNATEWGVLEADLFSNSKGTSAGLKMLDLPITGTETAGSVGGSAVAAVVPEKAGTFGGLGGYVGKGLRAVSGQTGTSNMIVGVGLGSAHSLEEEDDISEEALVVRGDQGIFYDGAGRISRSATIDYSSSGMPEDLAYNDPYIISVIPAQNHSQGKVEIRLKQTLSIQQLINIGATKPDANSPASATVGAGYSDLATIRFLSVPKTKGDIDGDDSLTRLRPLPALYMTTPVDKIQLQSEGTTLWALQGKNWKEMLEDLVKEGKFEDARGLLKGLKGKKGLDIDLVDYDQKLRRLSALAIFAKEKWEPAIEEFISLDIAPAKVVSLYPTETISGRLHVNQDGWVEMFGGPVDGRLGVQTIEQDEGKKEKSLSTVGVLRNIAHLGGGPKKDTASIKGKDTASIRGKDTDSNSIVGDDGTVAGSSKDSIVEYEVCPPAALEALIHYLSDRRQKLAGAMASLSKPAPKINSLSPFKLIPTSELQNYPDVPFNNLSPEQLVRTAQIVYTALLKVYLAIRPVLVGSLCRIENWCEVEEVEELLLEKKRYTDLIDLYQGKKMHSKALSLLRQLAKDENDKLDKLDPTVRYLQKLGPDHLNLILSESDWIFKEDANFALRVFTADEAEVEALPRNEVLAYLLKTDEPAAIGYLEHITDELGEAGPDFHDKLAELYLKSARRSPNNDKDGEGRLLEFLKSSEQYRPDRLIGKMRPEELPRTRAILLGKLGNHEGALHIYVHRLKDFDEAEEYCSRVYRDNPDPHGIYLLLLKIYLRSGEMDVPLLEPALTLIGTHGNRIDAAQTIDLLPPDVTMKQVHQFFVRKLRDTHSKKNQDKITKALLISRKDQVDRSLAKMQQKRVRITDMRICPQCHKRIGQSAIAVHAPRGEVTHYNCKDAFSQTLALHRT